MMNIPTLRCLRLSIIAAPWLLAVAIPLLAQASAPPAPIVLFTATGNSQASSAIDASLHVFCAQQQCRVSRSDISMTRSSTPAETLWSITPENGGGVVISAFERNNVLDVTASVSRMCRLAQWPLVHKIQLIAAVSHAGISVDPGHDEKCISANDDRSTILKPQATSP